MNTTTIFITGATDGIGKLAAHDLAMQNKQSTVILHGRNNEKLQASINNIKKQTGNNNIDGFLADFSSLEEVRQMAAAVLAKYNSINILINNAGAGFSAPRYGKDGMETRITVNYFAPFLLTNILLPALKNAGEARIVNVSSAGQSAINFDDIMFEKNFDGIKAYTQSKLALMMFTIDLANQLKNDHITVNALHPGTYLDTNMVNEAGIKPLGTAQSGAGAIVHLATATGLKNITGKYFNVHQQSKAHVQAYDEESRKKLRDLSLKITGLED